MNKLHLQLGMTFFIAGFKVGERFKKAEIKSLIMSHEVRKKIKLNWNPPSDD